MTKFDKDGNGYLSNAEIAAVKSISVSNKGISSLKGIELFTALEELVCDNNNLTTLDLSKNVSLKSLHCSNNKLTSLILMLSLKLLKLLQRKKGPTLLKNNFIIKKSFYT